MSRNHGNSREEYLEATSAVVTPLEAMALWVAVWESQQQTKVRVREGNTYYNGPMCTVLHGAFAGTTMSYTNATEQGIPDSDLKIFNDINYSTFGWYNWTPTVGGIRIPAGFGSSRLDLLILPDAINQPLDPATDDSRPGWEWGHSNVYILKLDSSSPNGFRASTNQSPRSLHFPEDVVKLARRSRVRDLAESLKPQKNKAVALTKEMVR
jgi:hypothetical protein